MKKLAALMMVLTISLATFAQHAVVVKKEDKVRHTSTLGQKAHNLFSKHKRYNGYKTKHTKQVKYVKH